MSKVYIPMVPSKFDTGTKLWIPSINLEPAKQHGELVVMLQPNSNRLHTTPLIGAIRDRMEDYGPEDWLVAVGDPSILAAAAVIAHRKAGVLRILKWDRITSAYLPVEMTL